MFKGKNIDMRSSLIQGLLFTGKDDDSHFVLHPEIKYINCTFENLKPTINNDEFSGSAHFYYQDCKFVNSPDLSSAFETYGLQI
jgi:hypothetical protein